MQLHIANEKGVPIQPGMIGLFFEDINYAADGGLYAEMIENRSFESLDCSGTVGDYYTVQDCGYAWHPTTVCGEGAMAYVMGSPVNRVNPHYLRFTASQAGQGFWNQAYSGIHLEKGMKYNVSFYAVSPEAEDVDALWALKKTPASKHKDLSKQATAIIVMNDKTGELLSYSFSPAQNKE